MGSTQTATRTKRALIWPIVFAVILVFTAVLRLYRISAPVADWHSFRQVDTASVARIFTEQGIDLLHPRYHDLSNIQSGKDNPQGFRMVELPLYQAAAAGLAGIFPSVDIDILLRLVTIASSVGTAALIMGISSLFMPLPAAGMAGLLFAVLPYSVFYGRAILPEPFAVFWAMLSVYILARVTGESRGRKGWGYVLTAAAAGAIALLVKPTAGFLLLPVPYLIFRRSGLSRYSLIFLFSYSLISVLPILWWRNWIQQYPEGIPVFDWLFNKDNIRFKGAWFRWLFAERIGNLILGYWGLIPLGIGLMSRKLRDETWLVHLLGIGALLYLSVFAGGNVQHDYYQIILLPPLVLYAGRGMYRMLTDRSFLPVTRIPLVIVSVAFAIAFSWYTVKTYYWINRPEIIEAGQAADRLLPGDAKVIAPYNGDTTFLYQTGRSGWPLGFDIDGKISMGATHYVTVSPTDADFETMELANTYTVLVRNEKFAIIDLTRPKDSSDN